MDKITYLAELAEGLARWVPERERQDILRYYAEYFEEAGPGREGEVVAELGDPWALSCRLAVEGGFVTQEGANAWTPPREKRKVWPFVLAGTLAAVAIVAVSVGMFAARVGRFVGRAVIGTAEPYVVVEDQVEHYGFVPVPSEALPEVIFSYTDEMTEVTGGFWSREDGFLEAFDSVDVDVDLANVTVTAGEDYTLAIQQSAALGGYNITWEMNGDTLKLRDSSKKTVNVTGLQDLFSDHSVDIIITVPESALMDKVSLKTGLGDVFVAGLYVEKVTAETGLGNAQCYEVHQAKKIGLESGMGDVTVGLGELPAGLEIDLETGVGHVEANLGCTEGECKYELESGLGNVTVNGVSRGSKAERKGNTSVRLDAESGTGDVNVNFQEDRW